MSDETPVAKNESNVNKETPKETNLDPKEEQINNLNTALRSERAQLKEVRKELDALKNSHLEEQGKFKELYETNKTELESAKSKLSGYESHFSAAIEAAKKEAPAEVLELLPSNLSSSDQLTWLSKATAAFKPTAVAPRKVVPPGMINPSSNDSRVSVSQEEFEKMDPVDRIKHLDTMGFSKKDVRGY